MTTFLIRVLGLLLLTGAITITSCQAVFPQRSSADAPERQRQAPVHHAQ
jgi:hypothetical protein